MDPRDASASKKKSRHLAAQHSKSSSLAKVHGQAPVADGDVVLGEPVQGEGGHVASRPDPRQGGRHRRVDGKEAPGIDVKASHVVGNLGGRYYSNTDHRQVGCQKSVAPETDCSLSYFFLIEKI